MRRRGFLGSLLGLLALRKMPAPEVKPVEVPHPSAADIHGMREKYRQPEIHIYFAGPGNFNPGMQGPMWDALPKRPRV